MVTNVFFLSNKMRAEVLSIGLKPIDEINRPSMRCFLKKRHPRWALNLPLHTFLKHQTIKRFVGNKKHSYSLSFNVPRRLRPISTTSRSSHWGPHAFQMPTRSDPLVLFLERFSRFSLTAFYTTFIYGAQANIDGCNTNLDSIFRGDESLSIYRAAKPSQPLHFLEFSHDTRSIDACARDCACTHTVRLHSSAHKFLWRTPTLTYVRDWLSFYRRKPPSGGLAHCRTI